MDQNFFKPEAVTAKKPGSVSASGSYSAKEREKSILVPNRFHHGFV
ncbi:hypothetical protein LEP1GSC047_1141 [Leptospira inadai serovar Lyme str. 10]|uniref:Uncharacterized protein n=1 Tax=Leptospira inadai serovar Lyme str. 10 TaxID=1049790 RepID=V6HGS8_9LEPT|nr:hypothetical protein LEP1GSC047_1141 [Leptospira inadai serovar Lyme str. 10]